MSIVESILTRDADAESRVLPYGTGSIEVEKVFACDVSFDTMADVDAKTREDKRFTKHGDFSIAGLVVVVALSIYAIGSIRNGIASLTTRSTPLQIRTTELQKAIEDNLPYDQFARELLTAAGSTPARTSSSATS